MVRGDLERGKTSLQLRLDANAYLLRVQERAAAMRRAKGQTVNKEIKIPSQASDTTRPLE